jgi:hypothetical protein
MDGGVSASLRPVLAVTQHPAVPKWVFGVEDHRLEFEASVMHAPSAQLICR